VVVVKEVLCVLVRDSALSRRRIEIVGWDVLFVSVALFYGQ
jgi:hypothetical protein